MSIPHYRDRYLPAMTPAQIAALPDKERAPVLLAVGAIEQHGPHLPVAVDALMGQVWLTLALERLPPEVGCYVAPPITVGKSNEHTGFPGTLSVSRDTLRGLLLAIGRQLAGWGFRRLGVVNTHGGNVPVLGPTLREIRDRHGMRAEIMRTPPSAGLSPQEAAFGIHAGEVETSWMLAAAPGLVDMSQAQRCYFASLQEPGGIKPVAAPLLRAWATKDLSPTGILGDAPAATAEKGRRWLEAGADAYAAQIRGWFDTPT